MKIALIIFAAIIIAVYITFKSSTNGLVNNSSRPPKDLKPPIEVANDKIIMVSGVNHSDIIKALNNFCNLYNKTNYSVLPRLYQLSETEFAVTFPYNTDMSMFCFAVNYLKYPVDIKWQAKVYGWATINAIDDVSDPKLIGKLCVFYLVDDKEYDNVYLTSVDNVSYKVPFTNLTPKTLNTIVEVFKNNKSNINDLEYKDFE